MYREENLTIDLKVKEYNPLRLKQMDTTKLNIELIDSGLEIDLTNLDVDIVFTKPNDTIVMQSSNITKVNNIITVILLEDCLRLPGLANMEVELRNDTQVVSSFFIPITIEKTSKNNIESDNTPNYIEEMENKVKSIEQRGNELIEEIQKNYQDIVDEDLRKEIMDARKNYDTLGQRLDESLSKDYTGTNITAPTVAGWGRIKKLYGRTVEEGTGDKSPDNPYTLKCVGDDVNLFDINWINTTLPTSANFLLTDKEISVFSGNYCFWVKLEDGTTLNNSDMAISLWNGDTRVLTLGAGDTVNITQEQASVISSLRLYFANASYAGKKIKEIKLHKGSIKTAYSPYGYGTVENISTDGTNSSSNVVYVDKPLCSVGDIRDELDYTKRKIIRRCMYKVFNGNEGESWIKTSDDTVEGRVSFWILLDNDGLYNCPNLNIEDISNIKNVGEYITASSSAIQIGILKNRLNELSGTGFKEWLKTNPITVIYKLPTPTIEDIDCSDKIVQYANSTTVYNRDGAEIEVNLTNNDTVSGLNEVDKVLEDKIEEVKAKHEEMNTYSTEEQVLGTWIDGKPIYRQFFSGTSFFESATVYIATLRRDVDTLVRAEGYRDYGDSGAVPSNDVRTAGNELRFQYAKSEGTIPGYYAIVEYTKTTD